MTPRELSRSVLSNVEQRAPTPSSKLLCVRSHLSRNLNIGATVDTFIVLRRSVLFFTFNAAAVFPFFHMQIVKRFVVLHLQNWSCIRETKSITNTFSELCVCVTGIYIKLYFFLQDICKICTLPTIFNSHILLCMQPPLRFGSRQS